VVYDGCMTMHHSFRQEESRLLNDKTRTKTLSEFLWVAKTRTAQVELGSGRVETAYTRPSSKFYASTFGGTRCVVSMFGQMPAVFGQMTAVSCCLPLNLDASGPLGRRFRVCG